MPRSVPPTVWYYVLYYPSAAKSRSTRVFILANSYHVAVSYRFSLSLSTGNADLELSYVLIVAVAASGASRASINSSYFGLGAGAGALYASITTFYLLYQCQET